MRAPLLFSALGLGLTCGCADYALNKGAADTGGGGGGTSDTATAGADEADSGGSDTASVDSPELYGIGGTLEVTKGALVGGVVRLTLEDETRDAGLRCVEERSIATITALDTPPDPAVFLWVQVTLEAAKVPCTGSESVLNGEEGVYLGLGSMHPDLLPALAAAGYDTELAAEQLYGVYAAIPGDASCAGSSQGADACVFGYGGTESNLSGEADAATKAPLPDGSYSLTHVYLFDIAS